VFGADDILTLNEAAGVVACRDVRESDIDRQIAKQRDADAMREVEIARDTREPKVMRKSGFEPLRYFNRQPSRRCV